MGDWFDIGGSALGAVGSIGGGLLGSSQSTDGFSQKGAGQQLRFEYFGAPTRGKTLKRFAKAAGLHPLAVIGSGAQAQPVIMGQPEDNSALGYGISNAMKDMGQDIMNAKMRSQTEDARDLELLGRAVDIENDTKYGELLTEQLRQLKNPPMPERVTPEGNVIPQIREKPAEVVKGEKGAQHGANPQMQYFQKQDPNGVVYYSRAKGEKYTESTEEDIFENLEYMVQRGLVAAQGAFKAPYPPPTNVKLEPGKQWRWNTGFPYQGWFQTFPEGHYRYKILPSGKMKRIHQ